MDLPAGTVKTPVNIGDLGTLLVPVGPGCTTIVGPNAVGKGGLLRALVAGWAEVAASAPARLASVDADGAEFLGWLADLARRDPAAATGEELAALFVEAALEETRFVVPEVAAVRASLAPPAVELLDVQGAPCGRATGVRASLAVAAIRVLARFDEAGPLVIEEPGAFLHPLAQEALRERLVLLACDTGARVVLSSESTFVIPRSPDDLVLAVARSAQGHLEWVGQARGDDRHADLVGGLFRDPGLAVVLDRAATLGPDVRGVLVFEGGTDEAYLRLAAATLGRDKELDGIAIVAAGGASAAALQAVVLRAETALPLLVVLDNDEPGRRARETLVKRLSFEKRREVTSYAEVLPGYPEGAEAEDMFDDAFVGRFVEQVGARAITGQWSLWRDVQHYDLTSWAKSAFVRWAEREATPSDVASWGKLLDVLQDRLGGEAHREAHSDA